MEVLQNAPTESQFTPLSTHQSQTPSSFHSGPPVLHHYSPSTTILINSIDLAASSTFQKLVPSSQQQTNGSSHPPREEDTEDSGHEIRVEGVDFDDHDPEGTISLAIVPTTTNPPQQQHQDPTVSSAPSQPPSEAQSESQPDPVEKLFAALSACADLHPDPASNSDIDIDDAPEHQNAESDELYTQIDGLPPPMPGSGGWITAENVGEFFDEEGNFRGRAGGGGLGEGAGRVRGREEDELDVDGDGVEGANGVGEGEGEGEGEEAKWRRTG
ncbi:MAG: hypothetical protein Q9166_000618 [cf. Caloplaca sp. 2 TL-2023]